MNASTVVNQLRQASPLVLPSMLLCDFARLSQEIADLEEAGAKAFHLDVMDGHFVPNFTYGMTIVKAFRQCTTLPLDVHLMIDDPARYLESFHQAGADVITIHAEAVDDPRPVLEAIRSLGAAAGLAINPPTPIESVQDALDLCDLVLVMSVMPGFGGQTFDERAVEKLRDLRSRLPAQTLLEVDGGIHTQTIGKCAQAGADLFVVGSAIFQHEDYQAPITELTELARAASE